MSDDFTTAMRLLLGERPSLNGWLGILLISTGAILIAIRN